MGLLVWIKGKPAIMWSISESLFMLVEILLKFDDVKWGKEKRNHKIKRKLDACRQEYGEWRSEWRPLCWKGIEWEGSKKTGPSQAGAC